MSKCIVDAADDDAAHSPLVVVEIVDAADSPLVFDAADSQLVVDIVDAVDDNAAHSPLIVVVVDAADSPLVVDAAHSQLVFDIVDAAHSQLVVVVDDDDVVVAGNHGKFLGFADAVVVVLVDGTGNQRKFFCHYYLGKKLDRFRCQYLVNEQMLAAAVAAPAHAL